MPWCESDSARPLSAPSLESWTTGAVGPAAVWPWCCCWISSPVRSGVVKAKAFAGDPQALKLSLAALERGWIAAESQRPRRQFWLMPLLHSEDISVVAQAIPLLEHFADAATADVARRHLLQLQRFGRYPHRNAALGRVSSPEEVVLTQQSQR